jgi:CO/xanthine dehydrogenase FAD-binding subunit
MGIYLRPAELDEALRALHAERLVVLAGGTDFYPARVGRTLDDDVLDITALPLRGIDDGGDHWRIGALATWSELIAAPLPPCFDGLKLAAREVGGVQIQNAGTVAGNLCNASPAADGVPPLLALDAEVELASAGGERRVPLGAFVTGNRRTARRADELVTAIRVPKPAPGTASTFLKLGARRYLVISIVMVAATIEPDPRNQVGRARVAVGACAPTAQRLPALESALSGLPIDAALGAVAAPEHLRQVLAPIDDVRGSAGYRNDAALTLVRRALAALGAQMERAPNAERSPNAERAPNAERSP